MIHSKEYEKLQKNTNIDHAFLENIKNMEESITKAAEMTSALQEKFATPEAKKAGKEATRNIKETKTAQSSEEKSAAVEVKYFTKKDPETW